ncbi:MAG: serine/threonine protein kinase, partial [Planctomycetes bacterium]|nr:serine/threonine protein kinase [Planctomycetota bacterium]
MSDSKQERLRFLFDQALDLPRAKRAEFLEVACVGEPAMKARVEALLFAAEDERFLASPTGPKASATTAPLAEGPGTRIGPYKLLQQIGEGGFGVVFMAEQEKPVTRRVALKIIKLGMDTRQVVARFEQERQALALMDHPNIARVIDAGATETGRPYFVMELVKGEPIVEYCDREQLSIDERLALFTQVCNAVQHAHSKGIIHRDLKPSNILVGTQDGKPLAKIIDFGIAKAT